MSSPAFRIPVAVGAVALLAALASCSSRDTAEPAAPAASIIDLMRDPIASNSEVLWNAVGSVSNEAGSKDLAPSTDAEWAMLRLKAQGLMDAADQLVQEGRVVAHPGQKLKDPQGENDLTPEQAQAAIDKDRTTYAVFAGALKAAGGAIQAAIDKRDVEAYTEAGGTLYESCEGCHQRYWHPDVAEPPGK
jgi:cytochrome c556